MLNLYKMISQLG